MNKRKKSRQVMAVIGIILLVLLYVSDLILALIGTDESRDLLKITITFSIALPILLYGLLVAMQKTSWFTQSRQEELTPEQKDEARRLMREAEEKEERERREKAANRTKSSGGKRSGRKN